jgi:hypothetical protein
MATGMMSVYPMARLVLGRPLACTMVSGRGCDRLPDCGPEGGRTDEQSGWTAGAAQPQPNPKA